MGAAIIGSLIGTGIAFVIAYAFFRVWHSKQTSVRKDSDVDAEVCAFSQDSTVTESRPEFEIRVETIKNDKISDQDISSWTEIKDNLLLQGINSLIPAGLQTGVAVGNAIQYSGGNIYRAYFPAGAKLAQSHDMEGAVRGFWHGQNGIKGHVNWVELDTTKQFALNVGSAALGLLSVAVGQYYLANINHNIGKLQNGISDIRDFLQNEYHSKVISLMEHVKAIADYQTEILKNDDLRHEEIARLNDFDKDCTDLLEQANRQISGFLNESPLDYKKYAKAVSDCQKWRTYQAALLHTLYQITDLKYWLHLGTVSEESCYSIVSVYNQKVREVQKNLIEWHEEQLKKLRIDPDKVKRTT